MKVGTVAVLTLVVSAVMVAGDVTADVWQNYADEMRKSMGFGDAITGNPDFAVALAGKSAMTLLGNQMDCVNNQAVKTLAEASSSTNNPIYVPGGGGFYSAYKLFLNSIKPKTTNNPGLIPQLSRDKQNYLKLADKFGETQTQVFTKYNEYMTAITAVKGSRPLDMISWRAKYFPKYKLMEDSVSEAKTKIDTAEALLWGPAYTTIQDAKKKLEMAESLETSTGYNMPVCPLTTQKLLQDYEDPSNWANTDTTAPPDEDPNKQPTFNYVPLYSIPAAKSFIDEMRNKLLHDDDGQAAELSITVTKASARASASSFGWTAWGAVWTPFFWVGGAATGHQNKASAGAGFESIEMSFAGHRLLTIDTPIWYDAALVKTFWNSLYPGMDKALFGPQGSFNLVPKQVMVAYNPSFKIRVSKSDWNAYSKTIAGFGHGVIPFTIGPFAVGATFAAGAAEAGTNAHYEDGTISVTTRSDAIYVIGIVGEKVISSGKSFMAMMEGRASANFAEDDGEANFAEAEEDDDSKNFLWGKKQEQQKPKGGSVAVPSDSDEPLNFDLKNVQVQRGEVRFAFTPHGFNVDKTDDAVFSAQLNLRKDKTPKLA